MDWIRGGVQVKYISCIIENVFAESSRMVVLRVGSLHRSEAGAPQDAVAEFGTAAAHHALHQRIQRHFHTFANKPI